MLHHDYENYVGFKDPKKDRSTLFDWKGAQRTLSLFKEPCAHNEDNPCIYSLREVDSLEYPSIYHIYMNSADEYEASIKILGSYKHWKKLCNLKWFVKGNPTWNFEGIEVWRKDMKLRDASIAKRVIFGKSKEGDLTAAKKLMDISGKSQDLPKRDKPIRPDKETGTKDLGNELADKIKALHSKIDK